MKQLRYIIFLSGLLVLAACFKKQPYEPMSIYENRIDNGSNIIGDIDFELIFTNDIIILTNIQPADMILYKCRLYGGISGPYNRLESTEPYFVLTNLPPAGYPIVLSLEVINKNGDIKTNGFITNDTFARYISRELDNSSTRYEFSGVDSMNNLYLVRYGSNDIEVYDSNFNFSRVIEIPWLNPIRQFHIHNDHIYLLSSSGQYYLYEFTTNGVFVQSNSMTSSWHYGLFAAETNIYTIRDSSIESYSLTDLSYRGNPGIPVDTSYDIFTASADGIIGLKFDFYDSEINIYEPSGALLKHVDFGWELKYADVQAACADTNYIIYACDFWDIDGYGLDIYTTDLEVDGGFFFDGISNISRPVGVHYIPGYNEIWMVCNYTVARVKVLK